MLNVPTVFEPIMQVCPTDVDFGEVSVGRRARMTLTITDFDGCHLHVSDIRFGDPTDAGFRFPDPPVLPMVVPSESSTNLDVEFRPVRRGRVSGSVEIACDDQCQAVAHVDLHGVGV